MRQQRIEEEAVAEAAEREYQVTSTSTSQFVAHLSICPYSQSFPASLSTLLVILTKFVHTDSRPLHTDKH